MWRGSNDYLVLSYTARLNSTRGPGDLFTVSVVSAVIRQATHVSRSQDIITCNSAADIENLPSGRVAVGGPETTTQSLVAEHPHFDSAGHVCRYRDTVSIFIGSVFHYRE